MSFTTQGASLDAHLSYFVTTNDPPHHTWPEWTRCPRQRHGEAPFIISDLGTDASGTRYRREIRVCGSCYMELIEKGFTALGIGYEVHDSRGQEEG